MNPTSHHPDTGADASSPVRKSSVRAAFALGVLTGVLGLGGIWAIYAWGYPGHRAETEEDRGYLIQETKLNDLLQWLAHKGGLQYWHNPELAASRYDVTGVMNPITDPMEEVEELALAFDLKVKIVRDTLYVLTPEQFSRALWQSHE